MLAGPEIYHGKAASASKSTSDSKFQISDGGDVTLNFVNADVREAIDTILGDILGVTYVVDPRVSGTVTMRTTKPIPQSSLIPPLGKRACVDRCGAGAERRWVQGTTNRCSRDRPASSVGWSCGRVRHSRYSAALRDRGEFAGDTTAFDTARPRVARRSRQKPFAFFGNRQRSGELQSLVDIFDVDWMSGRSFGLFPVEYAEVRHVIAQELSQLFGPVQGDGRQRQALRHLLPEQFGSCQSIVSARFWR